MKRFFKWFFKDDRKVPASNGLIMTNGFDNAFGSLAHLIEGFIIVTMILYFSIKIFIILKEGGII